MFALQHFRSYGIDHNSVGLFIVQTVSVLESNVHTKTHWEQQVRYLEVHEE
jgi:hypothetical protein